MSKRKHPGLPSMVVPPKSDLLSRVGAFLPQIKAANEDLEKLSDQKDVRVDLRLEPDQEKNDDSSSSSSSGEEDANEDGGFLIREHVPVGEGRAKQEAEEKAAKEPAPSSKIHDKDAAQIIELKIALGKFNDDNPMINMIAGEDDRQSKQPKEDEEKDEDETDAKPASSLLDVVGSKPKKKKTNGPLITELS